MAYAYTTRIQMSYLYLKHNIMASKSKSNDSKTIQDITNSI